MEIIVRGEIPKEKEIRFSCKYCGTIFQAKRGEYQSVPQMAQVIDGIQYECKCPVCQHYVFI